MKLQRIFPEPVLDFVSIQYYESGVIHAGYLSFFTIDGIDYVSATYLHLSAIYADGATFDFY